MVGVRIVPGTIGPVFRVRRLNLTFHGIGTSPMGVPLDEKSYWVDPDELEAVLELVRGRSDVRVTFDDGNASDVELALPRLLERGVTGTFFVLAGRLDTPDYVDRAGVRALLDAGMRVGSHGSAHLDWRTLDESRLTREVVDSRRELEALVGGKVDEASCPFGSYDRRVLRRLRAAGYRRVFTSDDGWTHDGAWLQTRNTLLGGSAVATTVSLLEPTPRRQRLMQVLSQTAKRWR